MERPQDLPPTYQRTNHRWFWIVLKVALSVGLLFLLISGMDLRMASNAILRISPTDVGLFWVTWSVVALLGAWKWQILLRVWGIQHAYLNLARWTMIGFFFNNLLPTGFGGDISRLYTSGRGTGKTPNALAVLFYDRLFAFGAFVLLGIVALFSQLDFQRNIGLWLLYTVVVGILLVLFGIVSVPWLSQKYQHLSARFQLLQRLDLLRWLESFQIPPRQTSHLLYAFGVGIVMQLAIILAHFVVSEALGLSISVTAIFVFVPLLYIAVALPISVNGIGVREAVFVIFFQQSNIPQSEAVTFSLTYFVLFLFFSLAGGFIYILDRNRTKNSKQTPDEGQVNYL